MLRGWGWRWSGGGEVGVGWGGRGWGGGRGGEVVWQEWLSPSEIPAGRIGIALKMQEAGSLGQL